jgi:nucleoside-diphosphate-sugar epimerase
VARLVRHDHAVVVVGRRPGITIESAEYRQCDVTDYAALREQVAGMRAIVHLAAIPNPGGGPGQVLFDINCRGTFNVYQAAADEGIDRIACASSINALGFFWGLKPFILQYLPVDEEHPSFTTDAYSFSKQVTESIADYFWRREGISSVNVRLPGVYEPGSARTARIQAEAPKFRAAFEALMALPEAVRRERVQRAIDKLDATRPARSGPMARDEMRRRWQRMRDDPDMLLLTYGGGRGNFWSGISAENSAQAFEKSLLVDYRGSHAVYVNDGVNRAGILSETLARVFYPEVTVRKHELSGMEPLVRIEKARRLIGYEPVLA